MISKHITIYKFDQARGSINMISIHNLHYFETSHSHHSHSKAFALSFATSWGTETPSPSALQPLTTLQHHY